MGYELRGVVGAESVLRTMTGELPGARSVPLGQGLSLMPMTDDLFDSVTDGGPARALGFWWLPGGFDVRLAEWSGRGPVAYVEAEYFGGVGEQQAAVWADGGLVLGPLRVAEGEPFPEAGSPVSRALRRLGAVARGGEDEFSAVGLGRHRYPARWLG
ncbi:hypothetical protein [Streptomyces sp. NPDC002676]